MSTNATAGRPAGAGNRDYVAVVVRPPVCPHCHGTHFEPREQTVTRKFDRPGEDADGRIYNKVIWYKARCRNDECRQWCHFVERHLAD